MSGDRMIKWVRPRHEPIDKPHTFVWGIWYSGVRYEGPRWCFSHSTRRGCIRLERESPEACESDLNSIRAWNTEEPALYEIRPIIDDADLAQDRVLH